MTTLIVENLTKHFSTRGQPLEVLQNVSFQLSSGDNMAVLGPSGSGKSTLLHVIGTLDQPTAGRLTLDGANPFELDEHGLADFRNRQVGFIFQDHHLLPQLSVLENALVPALAAGSVQSSTMNRARQLLDRVGLSERLDHRPSELSGGERQRAAVARALIHRPALLLADEPTGSLDRKNAEAVGLLLLELQSQENAMLIVVTHNQQLAEQMERRAQLVDGKLEE